MVDGEYISSDGSTLLPWEVQARTGIIAGLPGCFQDYRGRRYAEHPLNDLTAQWLFVLAQGYGDPVDHDRLRAYPLSGKTDPAGTQRNNPRNAGKALAGKSTLNRVELSSEKCCKTLFDSNLIRKAFVNPFIRITDRRSGEEVCS